MPTRSLKALWPLITGVISVRRKSATALISSVGVGSSCISPSSRREQSQQIDLRLRGAPANHGAFHGMVGAGAETLHHAAAHDAPAQRAHHFPEHHTFRIDLAAGFFVPCKQLFAGAKAADRLVDLAEAPGVDADPTEVLHGVADMRELPIQHG